MSTLRAEFIDEGEAFRVYILNVIPPFVFFALVLQLAVEARLSEVFFNNLISLDGASVRNSMVRSAVFATGETFSGLEVFSAGGASPSHESGSEVKVVLEVLHVLIELLDEVQS